MSEPVAAMSEAVAAAGEQAAAAGGQAAALFLALFEFLQHRHKIPPSIHSPMHNYAPSAHHKQNSFQHLHTSSYLSAVTLPPPV